MRNAARGWTWIVGFVPCDRILAKAGYEQTGSPWCWRRDGNPFPCSGSKAARAERQRVYEIARRMGYVKRRPTAVRGATE